MDGPSSSQRPSFFTLCIILHACCFPELSVHYAVVSCISELSPTVEESEINNDIITDLNGWAIVKQSQYITRLRSFQRHFAEVLVDQMGIRSESRIPIVLMSTSATYTELRDALSLQALKLSKISRHDISMHSPDLIRASLEGEYGEMFSFHYDMPSWDDLKNCFCPIQHNFRNHIECEKCEFDKEEVYNYTQSSARKRETEWERSADMCVTGKVYSDICPYVIYTTKGLTPSDTPYEGIL